MTIIDTHCHIDFQAFDQDRDAVIQRAQDAGVAAMILIGIHPESWKATSTLVNSRTGFVRAAGVHPTSVAENWNAAVLDLLTSELEAPDIVAVGETGLDYYRSKEHRDQQLEAFEQQLGLAASMNLPVVIHQRQAENEVLHVLERFAPVSGVMHCFGGNWEFARDCLDLGLHLGIGGVATFPRSEEVRQAIGRAPGDRLLVETDAPFLAPQRWRGKRNEPAYIFDVIQTIAEARGELNDRVEEVTSQNAIALFGSALANELEQATPGTNLA